MALTLQQRINVKKAVPLTDSVTFSEKAQEAIKKVAQDACAAQFLPNDAVFTGHAVTQAQLTEWALRALRGSMDQYMIPMILDSGRIPADPNAATDTQLTLATKDSVWPFAQLIGTGSI